MINKAFNYFKKNYSIVIIITLGLIYFLFTSNNPSADSYANAYASAWGEELFKPHHLLYNYFGFLLLRGLELLIGHVPSNPIIILQGVNTLFAIASLFVLRNILKRINTNENLVSASIFFVGTCFGLQRFAIDNECYIMPLFFSLLAMNYIQSFLRKNTLGKVVLSSLFISIAILFHQIAIWVFITSLLVVLLNKNRKYILSFLGVSLIIPLAYFIVYYIEFGSLSIGGLFSFILNDYSEGMAEMPIISNVLLLTGISFVRSFVQIHGYMLGVFYSYKLVSIIVFVLAAGLLVFGFSNLMKLKKRELKMFFERRYVRYIWVTLILSLAFASFSNGNAEFMVIIPFLIIILLSYYYTSSAKYLLGLGGAMFLWNIWFGLFPYAFLNLDPYQELAEIVVEEKDDSVFIVDGFNYVENIILYNYGKETREEIELKKAINITKEEFEAYSNSNLNIYTNIFDKKHLASREKLAKTRFKIEEDNPILLNKNRFQPRYKISSLGLDMVISRYN